MGKITEPLIAEMEQEAKATRRVFERIKNEHLAWKPHEKSMSTGQLSYHVAMIPGRVSNIFKPDVFDVTSAKFERPSVEDAQQLIPSLEESVAEAKTFLQGLDDARVLGTWKMVAGEKELNSMPRIAGIRAIMFNHLYHHRGELVVYLRLLNIPVPSVFGPSADENPFSRG